MCEDRWNVEKFEVDGGVWQHFCQQLIEFLNASSSRRYRVVLAGEGKKLEVT